MSCLAANKYFTNAKTCWMQILQALNLLNSQNTTFFWILNKASGGEALNNSCVQSRKDRIIH
jgi:hypothetical protein